MADDDGVGFDMIGAITTEKEQQQQDDEIAEFEAMLKKKQKKAKKKKKKPKKKADDSLPQATESTTNNGDAPTEPTSTSGDGNDDGNNDDDENTSNIEINTTIEDEDKTEEITDGIEKKLENTYWEQTDARDYPYTVLLDRIFRQLNVNNPHLMERQSHKLPPPQTALHGTKKTGWGNFTKICSELNRSVDHVKLFFLTEMNTTGNLDGQKSFILKGRWKPKQVESLLKKYIREYVTCNNCRSPKTTMAKDNATRLYFLTCSVCGASRSVAPIKAGYHAMTRDERRAQRNART